MKLTWSRTWPDRASDYSAVDAKTGEHVGRIYEHTTGGSGKDWMWFAQGRRGNVLMNQSGIRPTKQEAADALAECWSKFAAQFPVVGQFD